MTILNIWKKKKDTRVEYIVILIVQRNNNVKVFSMLSMRQFKKKCKIVSYRCNTAYYIYRCIEGLREKPAVSSPNQNNHQTSEKIFTNNVIALSYWT